MIDSEPPQMKAKISAELLKAIVEPPVEISPDSLTNFRWREDKLYVNSVDGANAIMVRQKIPATEFDTYDVRPKEDEIVFGMPCGTLENLLRAANPRQDVQLELTNEGNRMDIEFADVDYSLAGVDPEQVKEPMIPELEYELESKVHSSVFTRAYQVVGMISETVNISVSENEFVISGRGDTDVAKINVDIEESVDEIQEREEKRAATILHCTSAAQARYGSQFIQYLNKFTPPKCLTTRMSEDYPLQVETKRANSRIKTDITIAPRMDSE